MRAADLASLSERYPDGREAGTRGATRSLGVQTPIWDDLGERIFADFVINPPYGVGWWAPHPGTSRRIFISTSSTPVQRNDEHGRPIMRANVITQLPQEPDTSDVDVHLEPNVPPVLTEDVRQTLAGGMGSVRTLIEALAEQLIAAWDWRKANPDALQQPRAQWPRIGEEARAGRRQPFMGYAPGTHHYEPGQLMSHPRTMRKMAAAALFDHQRHQWPNFD